MESIDDDIKKIFSKHLQTEIVITNHKNPIIKHEEKFNENVIRDNKIEIDSYRKLNLIKKQKHFSIDDEDKLNKDEDDKNNSYFKFVINETLENDSIYCSYLDHFDKMWMNNKQLGNKNSLSCAGCFNQISYESQPIKHFTNFMQSNETINTFIDYFETYDRFELLEILKQMNKNNSNLSDEQLNELGLSLGPDLINDNDDFNKNKNNKHFICIKCVNCTTSLGVRNSENEINILFNCI